MFCIIIMSKIIIHFNYFSQYLKNNEFAPRLLFNSEYTTKVLIIDTSQDILAKRIEIKRANNLKQKP